MGRPPRAFDDGIFHLYVHASDTRFLFLTDDDRVTFLVFLTTIFGRHELCPIAYTLMGNHYHLLLHVPDERVSRAMQQLHTSYSRGHNRMHGRSAHLVRAHFGARGVESDDDFLTTLRYLAQNPVEAGLVANPLDWQWASSRAHAGVAELPIPLDEEPIRAAFDNARDWRERYRRFVSK
jgi:putative transposase